MNSDELRKGPSKVIIQPQETQRVQEAQRVVYDNSQAALQYRVQDTWTDRAGFTWGYEECIQYEVDGQVVIFHGKDKPFCYYDLNDPQQLEAAAREALRLGKTEAAFWPPPEPPKPFWDRVLDCISSILPGGQDARSSRGSGSYGGGGRDFNAGYGAALDPGEAWYMQQVGKNIQRGMDGK